MERELDQVAKRAPALPSLVRALDGFLGTWVADLSQGPNWRIFVTTALASGHAYAPGTQPHPEPHAAAVQRLTGGNSAVGSLADLLLAPVPTDEVQRMSAGHPVQLPPRLVP